MPKYNLQNKIPLKEIKFLQQVIKLIHKVRQTTTAPQPPVWSHRVRDIKKTGKKKKSTLGFNGA
jgi:hypothetical protein